MIDDEDRLVVAAWYASRGGMGGAGPLPFSGGYLDQPAALTEAFAICNAASVALSKARRKGGG